MNDGGPTKWDIPDNIAIVLCVFAVSFAMTQCSPTQTTINVLPQVETDAGLAQREKPND